MTDAAGDLSPFLVGPAWVAALSLFALVIRQFVPWFKIKVEGDAARRKLESDDHNTRRKLEIDEDASLRADLLKRVGEVERQLVEERKLWLDERRDLLDQMAHRDRECEKQIADMRDEIRGLHKAIGQASQSNAVLLGRIKPPVDKAMDVAIERLDRYDQKGEEPEK